MLDPSTLDLVGARRPAVTLLAGLDRVVTWVSPSVTEVLGWRPEDMIGSTFAEFAHPDDVRATKPAHDKLCGGEDPSLGALWIMRMRMASGGYVWMAAEVHVLLDDAGAPVGVASTFRGVEDLVSAGARADAHELRLAAVLDSFFDPHVLLGAVRDEHGAVVDFVFADANAVACEYLRVPREALLGSRLLERLPGHRENGLFARYVMTVETGEILELDGVAIKRAVAHASRFFDFRGVRVGDGITLTWRDVTDRVIEAEALARSEARYRLLAENASDVVGLGDNDGSITWVSESVTGLLGWSAGQLVGRQFTDLVHPDDRGTVDAFQRRVPTGSPDGGTVRLQTANGGWRWVSIAVRPMFGDDGAVVGRVAAWRDADTEMQARLALEESEARYRLLAENASDVVVLGDVDGSIDWISDSVTELIGWKPEHLAGQAMIDLVHPDDLPTMFGVQQELRAGSSGTSPLRLRTADGGWRWISRAVRPVHDAEGRIAGRVAAWRDAERETRVRLALEESEAKYRFLVENVSDVAIQVDAEARITWVSPSVVGLSGWTPEQLLGRIATDFVVEADQGEMQRVIADVRAGCATTYRGRIQRPDGSTRWVSATVRPTLDETGAVVGMVGSIHDVEDVTRALAVAEEERNRAQATVATLLDPHVILRAVRDETGEIVDFVYTEANDAACVYNRTPREELLGTSLLALLPAHAQTGLLDMYRDVVETGEPLELDDFEYPHEIHADTLYFDIRAAKLGDAISFTWRDVTDRHNKVADLGARATRDVLTGLANRSAIVAEIDREIVAAARSQRHVAVLLVDLDHFKNVNDTLGHPIGDELLKAAAQRFTHLVRAGDLVGRLGGDEFVVVMRDLQDPAEASAAASRLVTAFHVPLVAGPHEFHTTLSVGVTVAHANATPDDLLREADTALYEAKGHGRDRIAIFNENLRAKLVERVDIESQLHSALSDAQLALWYHPEVDLHTGQIVAAEALLRWHHPSGEIYTADRFIEVAEGTGLIVDIGDWVLDQACRQAAAWAAARPEQPITVRINLSARQLSDPGLLATLDEALTGSGVDPGLLCVEITETTFLQETTTVHDNLSGIRARGLHIALDDFGIGYASLAYLRRFPIHVIKIDRSFTAAMVTDDYERRLVAGILSLAELLDMRVVAEGIEHPEQARLLAELGCDSGQGFLYSPAVPADEFEQLVGARFDR